MSEQPSSPPGAVPPPPPFDPELAEALAPLKDAMPPGMTPEDIQVARRGPGMELLNLFDVTVDGAFTAEDRTVPGPEGAPPVSLLICRPTGLEHRSTALPVLYHVHGGGMVLGNNRAGVDAPLSWARELGAVVVSVEYRLAPEHPHPAPVEDAYAGLLWTAAHAAEIGGDPDRIVLVGASAGGGLCAALSLLLRDRQGPSVIGQLLMSPMLDDRNDTVSAHQMAGLGVWDRTANETGWTALLGPLRGTPGVSPYAAPARATDLTALPPTYLDAGSAETFRDEILTYATRLYHSATPTELHIWPGAYHGFETLSPTAHLTHQAHTTRQAWLHHLLEQAPSEDSGRPRGAS
ncbi:alpha/beta hydrolase [Streptomyces sp. J2-1]|uniref:alpha/beta hydrolase n=1 Tax=Streptomyces corallincola TaxID=2851888 RepID=UPI001C3908DE|nr:alpha/beta hydrolase [Streptomyces corallincola]MBV2357128.1 alpha/beta hydrolase [Streptomyces corallincola]